MDNTILDGKELNRYQRQIILKYLGTEGQIKLKKAHILIAGIGGLGSSSSLYLTAAGVGHITIVDHDYIQLSDLNRQILYTTDDIGKRKVIIASERLSKLNSTIEIKAVEQKIDKNNVYQIINDADIVIDGLDNMDTRFIINSACVDKNKIFITAGISQFRGMTTTIIPGKTPCLACFYSEGIGGIGVIGMIAGIIGNIQALEAIKIILGLNPSLAGKMLLINGENLKFKILDINKNINCPICGNKK